MLRFALLACMALVVSAGWFDWNGIEKKLYKFNLFQWDSVKKQFEESNNVCHTQECFQIAADYWAGMNKSVDPCEDFYEYVCGNWADANPIPPTELVWSPVQKMRKKVNERIRDLLEEPIKQNDILPVKQTKKFYKSCMDLGALKRRGIKPIEAFLVRNGGWPMIMEPGEWNSEQSLIEIDEYYSELTFSPALYNIDLSPQYKETNSSTDDFERTGAPIKISLPVVPSELITFWSGKIFNVTDIFQDGTYAKYITEIAVIFAKERGANINLEDIQKDVKDIIEFEFELLNKRKTLNVVESDESYISIEEFQNLYDLNTSDLTEKFRIDWKKILLKFFGHVNFESNGLELKLIHPSHYIRLWADIMNNTDQRTIVNYIHWKFVSVLLPFTTSKMEELQYELLKDKPGVKEAKPRWEKCISAVQSMNDAVAYQFINKYFKNNMKEEAKEIFSGIQQEMVKHILKSDWISDDVRKLELEKIKKMKMNVGYPDWYQNITSLTSIYHGLVINNQYLDNVLSLRRHIMLKLLKRLKTPQVNNEIDWLSYPLIVNAFYNMKNNSFTVPAADFQLPIYSLTQPKTINYGELGLIISHEVAHGFDANGMLYDEKGKMYEDKWQEEINESFYNRTMCFVDQNFNYYGDNETRALKSSLGEDIADSLGLEIIFGTLEEKEKESRSLKLPGFEDWNNEQLFFLSYGKLWCRNAMPEFEQKITKLDKHSTPKYRVNIPLQNSEEFAKVFKCPKGSPMNPEIKCKIW